MSELTNQLHGTKPKFVIFEGADKVGKTSLFKDFRDYTDYVPLAIDRFTGSNIVYDLFYERNTSIEAYLEAEERIQEVMDCYLVVLFCPDKILERRIRILETAEDRDIALKNYKQIQELFIDYYHDKTRYKNKMLLDTGFLSQTKCLRHILDFTGCIKDWRDVVRHE